MINGIFMDQFIRGAVIMNSGCYGDDISKF